MQRATKAAIPSLCNNTSLVDKLKSEYNTFNILRSFQYHSFLVSEELHRFAGMVFDKHCAGEAGTIDGQLEDIVGPELKIKSVEPFIMENLLSWPLTIFTYARDDYRKVRTYIFRVRQGCPLSPILFSLYIAEL